MAKDPPSLVVPKPEDTIEIWLHLKLPDYEELKKTGFLRVKEDELEELRDPDCMEQYGIAYDWLKKQMKQHVSGYTGTLPLDAIYWPKPDLRYRAYFETGTEAVLIRCLVPASRVLLMSDDGWIHVLNLWHLALTEKESDAFDTRTEGLPYHAEFTKFRGDIEKSWELGLNIEAMNKSDWVGPCSLVYAWIEEIRWEDVVGSQYYTAVRRKALTPKKP